MKESRLKLKFYRVNAALLINFDFLDGKEALKMEYSSAI